MGYKTRQPVIIGIATHLGRLSVIKDTIDSLVHQADQIFICLNDLDVNSLPWSVNDYGNVGYFEHDRDWGDTGKFSPFLLENPLESLAYYLTCDDDLIYPPDYVERLVYKIEYYEKRAVVGYHGRKYFSPVESYYRSLRGQIHSGNAEVHRYDARRTEDFPVTVIGTGCTGWHSSLVKFTTDDFPLNNMTDIWFSKKLNHFKIPRMVVENEPGRIIHNPPPNDVTICDTKWDHDEDQTNVFNQTKWVL